MGLQQEKTLRRRGAVGQVSAVETTTVEILITPRCQMLGCWLSDLHLRRRFGVSTLAVHRHIQNIAKNLHSLIITLGDTLLPEGAAKISNVRRKNLPGLIFLNRLCKRFAAVMCPLHL